MFMAQHFGCQAAKRPNFAVIHDTVSLYSSAVHQDLPRVTMERGGSHGDTCVGELPSRPQTHWNSPWEEDSERTKPEEMLF